MARLALVSAAALAAIQPAVSDSCITRGTYDVATSKQKMEGGKMFCAYPAVESGSFPLLSFEHGDGGGGAQLPIGYGSFLRALASSGFVVCASEICPISCRQNQTTHQLNAIVAAQALGANGKLPIRSEGSVGVVGHSTGGMTTLKCSASDNVAAYGIGAAVAYNGDGGKLLLASDDVSFEAIDASLPMLLVTGTADIIEPKGSTESNHDLILAANPGQPLLTAMIDKEGHIDPNDIPLVRAAPLRAIPYVIAFLGNALVPSESCRAGYEDVMGAQLQAVASSFYDNRLFSSQSAVNV